MQIKNDIAKLAEQLWKEPKKELWEEFSKQLKKSKLKYYKVFYEKGKLKRAQDLTKSYAELYDAGQKPILKIPIFEKKGKKIIGATYYMKGLLTINKVDEWIR